MNRIRNMLSRGGRLRKTGRGVAIYAPWLGMVVAAAMGAGMVLGAGEAAVAQTTMPPPEARVSSERREGPATHTDVVCSGTATSTRNLKIPHRGHLTITDMSGFTANVAAGSAFHITDFGDNNYSRNLDLTLKGSVTATAGHGVYVNHRVENRGCAQNARGATSGTTSETHEPTCRDPLHLY